MSYRKIYINPTDWIDCHTYYDAATCELCKCYGNDCDGEPQEKENEDEDVEEGT